jgi:hypothetical protein
MDFKYNIIVYQQFAAYKTPKSYTILTMQGIEANGHIFLLHKVMPVHSINTTTAAGRV